ncbi:MAG: hypothetical protein SVX43_23460 [Cyanobacteriota bacterium]|nr:hypothetical protein [Cyanobacteriota bacterium]
MSVSDEFREYLKAGQIFEAMNLALGQAIELEITTWVSTEQTGSPEAPESGHCMRTRLNIVEGEVENEVGTQFIGNGPYRELREFHAAQVRGGQQMIQHNIESLQQVFTILVSTLSQLPKSQTAPTALSPSPSDREL